MDEQKKLQLALRKELKPLLVGLRNDMADLLREQKRTTAKEPPKVQDTKVTNHPEVQRVEQTNPQKEVSVKNFPTETKVTGLKGLLLDVQEKVGQVAKSRDNTLSKLFAGLTRAIKTQVFKVKVENPLDLTEVLQILEKIEKQEPPEVQGVKITNSKPDEAVPVVLVSHDLKRFYDVMVQLVGGGGSGSLTSLAAILAALNKIDANTDQLELKADTVILNVDELEGLIAATNSLLTDLSHAEDDIHVSGDKGVMGLGVRRDAETPLSPDGDYHPNLYNDKGRLKVDAQVVIMDEPRPGLRVAEFLRESGGSSDLNVDGSTTAVTFSAAPPTGKKWFIHSVSLVMEDASINFTKFGGIPGGLTNGIEFRVKEAGLAEITLGTFKTNGDLHVFTTDIRIDSAATDLLTLQANVKEVSGTTFELVDADSDVFKVIVNDNLTSINRFNVFIKGFEVDE